MEAAYKECFKQLGAQLAKATRDHNLDRKAQLMPEFARLKKLNPSLGASAAAVVPAVVPQVWC